jgi:hypothetical protein
MKWFGAGIAVFLIGVGSAVAQPPPPPATYAPIPPPRAETVPPPPGRRMLWEPGHWHWNGVRYIWIDGRYIPRQPHYGRYVEGRWAWAPHQNRWIWVPAHWQ